MRKEWQEEMSQIQRMHTWVLETEHILSGDWIQEGDDLTNRMVSERFDAWLATLQAQLSGEESLTEIEKECLMYFLQISRSLRPRLIRCYDIPGLPRTNNEMEGYIRGLKTRYRRVSGRKNWNAYLLRYGQSMAYFDSFELAGLDEQALFTCFCRVDHHVWHKNRDHHRSIQSDRLNVFRFRRQPERYLQQLENRWELTLCQTGVLP